MSSNSPDVRRGCFCIIDLAYPSAILALTVIYYMYMKKIVLFLAPLMVLGAGCNFDVMSYFKSKEEAPLPKVTVENETPAAEEQTSPAPDADKKPDEETPTSPSDTPAKAPASKPSATVNQVKIFLVALDDNGQSGKAVGCGDSAVAVNRTVTPTPAPLRAALEELLSVKDKDYGQSGLYNALYQSALRLDSVAITNGRAEVKLSGSLRSGGACDDPRIYAQLMETVWQFPTVQAVTITVNGKSLESLTSGR